MASIRQRQPAVCTVADCSTKARTHGMCATHYSRWRIHGDPLYMSFERGSGDTVKYNRVHARIVEQRGKASSHPCVGCDGPAAHWSYLHGCPEERSTDKGPVCPHIFDCYVPRCARCHKRFDFWL